MTSAAEAGGNGPAAAVVRLLTSVDLADGVVDDRRVSVSARHEAVLVDGRRVLLLDDRGWSVSGPATVWALTTVGDVEETSRVVVGPDEPSGERSSEEMAAGHWAQLAGELHRAGVVVDAADLARLPHDVVLSDRLRARLGSDPGEPAGR